MMSEETLECDDNIIGQQRSILGHSFLERCHLEHKVSQISGTLSFLLAGSNQFCIQCFPLVFLQLLDESVLHFSEERAIKLIPLSGF